MKIGAFIKSASPVLHPPSLKRRPEHLPFRVYVRDRHNPGLEQILITGAGGLIINGRNHCPAPHPGFLASS